MMSNRKMTMQVAGAPHKPGDILYINGERWVVTKLVYECRYSTIKCETLADYLARTNKIKINNQEMTIAEYLKILCDEYEYDCSC